MEICLALKRIAKINMWLTDEEFQYGIKQIFVDIFSKERFKTTATVNFENTIKIIIISFEYVDGFHSALLIWQIQKYGRRITFRSIKTLRKWEENKYLTSCIWILIKKLSRTMIYSIMKSGVKQSIRYIYILRVCLIFKRGFNSPFFLPPVISLSKYMYVGAFIKNYSSRSQKRVKLYNFKENKASYAILRGSWLLVMHCIVE